MSKEDAQLDEWLKGSPPATRPGGCCTRRTTGRRSGSGTRGVQERGDALERLQEVARDGDLTFLYASRDAERNNAEVLKTVLEESAPESF